MSKEKEILFKNIHPDPTDRMLRFYNLVDYSGVYKAMNEYADACLNEYLNAILCTKSIPMPKADSNSIAESINKYFKTK